MWKQVKILKNHSNFTPDFFDVFEVFGQLNPINNNPAFLMLLQSVYATYQGRFSRSGRPADDDTLSFVDGQVNFFEHMKFAVPLIYGPSSGS